MEKSLFLTGKHTAKILIDYLPKLNYAMILNDYKVFNNFVVINISDANIPHLNIRLSGDMFETCSFDIADLQPANSVSLDKINLMPSMTKLMALTEAFQTSFTITISSNGTTLFNESLPIMLLPFDQWHGESVMPELLASFVTPNHPCLIPICKRASEILKSTSGSGDIDDYQSTDLLRVRQQVEALYQALAEQKILYATMPASFEDRGQRIRLVDNILQNKIANCIDLSLLLCSCLEAMGLRTMIIVFQYHVIMGVWLDPYIATPMVGYEVEPLENLIDLPNSPLLVIESVALTKDISFKDALSFGCDTLHEQGALFNCYIDIRTARMSHIRPLPHSVLSNQGWAVTEMPDYNAFFENIEENNPFEIKGLMSAEKLKNKQLLWERKLLDLTLRNNLINMRSGKNILPLKDRTINEIISLLKQEKLLDIVEEQNNFATIKDLYRTARNSIEETGANTLFLSLGTLRWFENEGKKPFFAPIIFVPIEIVRHGARKYIVRNRDDESIINITLLEMMKQTFDLEIPSFMPLPTDDYDNVNYSIIFQSLQNIIDEVNEKQTPDTQWEIISECMIGIFSFSKFVMWNDIHNHADVLAKQPILQSLMDGHLLLPNNPETTDARHLDTTTPPAEYAIPLDVDSSQLEAVVDSGKNKSFIIYGPPGTGKSQTITNMIANALYHNKRILFVSEKKAALDVVYDRLKRIGLAPFCLEMHSNKANKKSFLSQMNQALNVPQTASPDQFSQKSEELFAIRAEINDYIKALHQKDKSGLSLYDYINRYLEITDEAMLLQYSGIKHLSMCDAMDVADKLKSLDTVVTIIAQHPAQHPLLGLYPRENTIENQNQLVELLAIMPNIIAKTQKKEQGWLNRIFLKRSALEIIQKQPEWNRFLQLAEVDDAIKNDLNLFASHIQKWNNNTSLIRHWYHYSLRALELRKQRINKVLDFFITGHTGANTANAFLKAYYQCIIINTIETTPALRGFSGLLFKDIIDRYRSLTRNFQKLTEQELVARLSQTIPTDETADKQTAKELTLLRKRITNNGRATTIRRIIDQIPTILPRLAPCMLMSPLSVAQYLKMQNNLFDIVIFDEASQMPTSEAVGAIARSKTVVVVGDPKQMPPTSFFETKNITEDYVEYDDLESILDDCISLGMPSHHLNWHYRSKHESLISFSNTHFYDGRLITFPSVDDQDKKVTLRRIDGYYDYGKTRSNKAEAKAIVQEVINRLTTQFENPNNAEYQRSIGIVAFSKVQSMLIEDMLMDALSKQPDLERIALQSTEPIFVKNLENVQGDERDIILFSIGYGPNKDGKVSMNFGPLNLVGGERRLNVAVSRARYEMIVFSTLQSYQIDLQRSNADGVVALKRFLEFAETNSLPQPLAQMQTSSISCLSHQIAQKFINQGYEVHFNVGKSNFKIDLAIVDKNNPSHYEKAIMLDGPTYYQTPTARDREIIQPAVLSNLGWNIQRLWTIDWLDSKFNQM